MRTSGLNIVVLGAGVQGTLYAVRFARAGHSVTLVARGNRGTQLRATGAMVRNAITGDTDVVHLPVIEALAPSTYADLCFVFVRREQIEGVLSVLRAAPQIERIVFMVNHANGSSGLFEALGRRRVVLGFPSAAGSIENGVDVYVDVAEQATAIERTAPDIAVAVRGAGFRVQLVADMDSWLKRHAVFVTAIAGALYKMQGDARLLSRDKRLIRTIVLAVREGWSALDRRRVGPPPLALRAIFCWVPLPFAVAYWVRFFRSVRGDLYFARHSLHAINEMAALAEDVDALVGDSNASHLHALYNAIRQWQTNCVGQ